MLSFGSKFVVPKKHMKLAAVAQGRSVAFEVLRDKVALQLLKLPSEIPLTEAPGFDRAAARTDWQNVPQLRQTVWDAVWDADKIASEDLEQKVSR